MYATPRTLLIESISKRLDALDEEGGHFTIEELVSALTTTGELQIEDLCREHPSKTINPAMLQSCLNEPSPEDRSE